MPVLLYGQEEKGEGLNMNEYSAMTPEIEKLAALCREHGQIPTTCFVDLGM